MRPSEPILELPPALKQEKPDWQYRSKSHELESMGISLWSWLVVISLSMWFCFWLVKALVRLAARMPL
jgi:hypothetical protein